MKTVLVVEDEYDLQQSICVTLEMEGYRTLCAANGRAALELLEKEAPPDLLITDYMMPYVSGYELLKKLYANPRFKSLPSLLITSIDGAAHPPKISSDVLQKPFTLESLLQSVDRLIGRA